jgi:hypothetical protein
MASETREEHKNGWREWLQTGGHRVLMSFAVALAAVLLALALLFAELGLYRTNVQKDKEIGNLRDQVDTLTGKIGCHDRYDTQLVAARVRLELALGGVVLAIAGRIDTAAGSPERQAANADAGKSLAELSAAETALSDALAVQAAYPC